jgi:hypothetical protein
VKELLFGKDSPGFAGCRFGDMTGFLVAERAERPRGTLPAFSFSRFEPLRMWARPTYIFKSQITIGLMKTVHAVP